MFNRFHFCRLMILMLFVVLSSQNTLAEIFQNETKPYTLGEVIVSGKMPVVEKVGSVREITDKDIRDSSARTLNEAIELLPGVDVKTGGDGVPRVNLRGFRSRHVILLLDGIPISNAYDGQFDPTMISTESISKIKVSYGNHSVLYGPGGLGGVINIITKKGAPGIGASVSAEVGEEDHRLGRFSLSGGQKMWDFHVSGSQYERDGYRVSNDFEPTAEENGDLRENSDKKRKNLFANLGFTPHDRLQIGAIVRSVKGEYGKPPGVNFDDLDPFSKKPKYERTENYEGYSGHLSVDYDIPGPVDVRSWVYLNQLEETTNLYDNNKYDSMDDVSNKGTFHEIADTQIVGGAVQTSCDLQSLGKITFGVDGRWEKWESDGYIRDVEVKKKVYGFRYFDEGRELRTYSAALEYEVSPFDKLGFVAGFSHHWFRKDDGDWDNNDSVLAGLNYDLFDWTRIWGSVARKIRFPSVRQMYDITEGNPGLHPEKSWNYEAGVVQRLPGPSNLSVTGFYIDVKDYIEKGPVTEIYENFETYCFRGFEVMGETRFYKALLVRAGYTFMDTENKTRGSEIEELQYRPRHKITVETTYSFDFGFSVSLSLMRIAGQYFYTSKEPILKDRLDDYTLFNAKIEQSFFNGRVILYTGIDNVFDELYEESYGLPREGRTIYCGIELRHWIGL